MADIGAGRGSRERRDPREEPDARDPFARVRVWEQKRFEDDRGYLHKIVSASQVGCRPWHGEVYVTAARPGQVKGNHLHHKMGETFTIIQGEGSLDLCDPTSGDRRRIPLSASQPQTVYVPPGLAHAIVNRGRELLICVAWAEGEHDPEDVSPYEVWRPQPQADGGEV